MICLGVPPTKISQPSASTPVEDRMPSTFEYTIGGAWATAFSTTSITTGGDTFASISRGFTFVRYFCESGWITNAKRLICFLPSIG